MTAIELSQCISMITGAVRGRAITNEIASLLTAKVTALVAKPTVEQISEFKDLITQHIPQIFRA